MSIQFGIGRVRESVEIGRSGNAGTIECGLIPRSIDVGVLRLDLLLGSKADASDEDSMRKVVWPLVPSVALCPHVDAALRVDDIN